MLVLALSGVSLFGAVFAQCAKLPDADLIENRLQSIVSSEGGEGTNPNATLLQHHFTCIGVGSTEGTARSLSIAVRYNVTSTDQPEVQRIVDLIFDCSGSNFVYGGLGTFSDISVSESLFNLTTRRDCYLCTTDSPTIGNCAGKSDILHLTLTTLCSSHHLVCDAMCAGGQGGCITNSTDCCQFYDVVTRMCITTCPAGSRNTTDYTCGTYTNMFELNNSNY